MSRPATLVIVGLAALFVHPGVTDAQDVQVYERRVDALRQTVNQARALRLARDTVVGRVYRSFESVSVGPVHLRVSSWAKPHALAAAGLALSALKPQFGRSLESLKGVTYVVQEEFVHDVGDDSTYVSVTELAPDGTRRFPQVVAPRADLVAATIRAAMLQSLARSSDPVLIGWLSGGLPDDTAEHSTWPGARVELLSSPAVVARRCYSGSVRDCRLAFALAPTTDPATELFNAADRRALVAAHGRWYNGRIDARTIDHCLGGADSACVSLLRNTVLPMPISNALRRSLVQLAIAVGGANAMERLLMTDGSIDERLAAAARVSTDSLFRVWSVRVRDTMQAPDNMSVGIAGVALGWILVCGGLAARSSRWR
jgi:hypothetical protein